MTTYLGCEPPKKCRRTSFPAGYGKAIVVILLVLLGAASYFAFSNQGDLLFSPAEPSIEFDFSSYKIGDVIGGSFSFVETEPIPQSSMLVINYGNVIEKPLSDFVEPQDFEFEFIVHSDVTESLPAGGSDSGKIEPEKTESIDSSDISVSEGSLEQVPDDSEDLSGDEGVVEDAEDDSTDGSSGSEGESEGESDGSLDSSDSLDDSGDSAADDSDEVDSAKETINSESSKDSGDRSGDSESSESSNSLSDAGASEGGSDSSGDSSSGSDSGSSGSSDSGGSDSSSSSGSSSDSGSSSSGDSGSDSGGGESPSLSPPTDGLSDGLGSSGSRTISGSVSQEGLFEYEVGDSDVDLVSVSVNGEEVDSDVLDYETSEGVLSVSTDYLVGGEIEIPFDDLGLEAMGGSLVVEVVSEDNVLYSAERDVPLLNEEVEEIEVLVVEDFGIELVELIVVGEPVLWKKEVGLVGDSLVRVDLPEQATLVEVKEIGGLITENEIESQEIFDSDVVETAVESDIDLEIAKQESVDEVLFSPEQGAFDYEIKDKTSAKLEVVYETPAPEADVSVSPKGLSVKISGPDIEGHLYRDVFVEVESEREPIEVYWVEEQEYIEFDYSEGMVSWIVPHLSEQTFEIIYITNAEHLDGNRTSIEDVYDLVSELDGSWVEIPEGDYLRVRFEKNLTSENDITIYARGDVGASVEVYEKDSSEIIALFDDVSSEGEYKVYLEDLEGEQDTFDLLANGGSVEFDYVVDPKTWYLPVSMGSESFVSGFSESSCNYLNNLCTSAINRFSQQNDEGCWFELNLSDFVGKNITSANFSIYQTNAINPSLVNSFYFYSFDGGGCDVNPVLPVESLPEGYSLMFPAAFDDSYGWHEFDLTSLVKDTVDAEKDTLYLFMSSNDLNGATAYRVFNLRYYPSFEPHLSVEYSNITSIPSVKFDEPEDGEEILHDSVQVNLSSSDESDHYSFVEVDDDLLFWATMDDTAFPDKVLDLSGNEYVGTVVGDSHQEQGAFGKSFSFDGVEDYINYGDVFDVPTGASRTVSFWINPSSTPDQYDTVLSKGQIAGVSEWAFFYFNGLFSFQVAGPSTAPPYKALIRAPSISLNEWHHFVGVMDGGRARFFVDGVESTTYLSGSSFTTDGTYDQPVGNYFDFTIGSSGSSTDHSFNGSVDEVLIFDRALSETEILALYNATANQYQNNFINLGLGEHNLIGYAADRFGNVNQTEPQIFEISDVLWANFTQPTPEDLETSDFDSVYVNLSSYSWSDYYSFVDFDNDLILRLGMSDISVLAVHDSSVHGNDGFIEGSVMRAGGGAFGSYLNFTGSGYVNLTGLESDSGSYTISFWILGNDTGYLFDSESSGRLVISSGTYDVPEGHLGFYLVNEWKDFGLMTNVGEWNHVVVTFDGVGETAVAYYNGNQLGSPQSYTPRSLGGRVVLGSHNTGTFNFFKGGLDEFILFDRVLSHEEILSLYDSSVNQYENDFVDLESGEHNFTGYIVNHYGNVNQTETRKTSLLGAEAVTDCRSFGAGDSGKFFILENDITKTSAQISGNGCFVFDANADNIIFDGRGHKIYLDGGGSKNGINLEGGGSALENITLRDFWIDGFELGIYSMGLQNSSILNNTINDSVSGIVLTTVFPHSPKDNLVMNNIVMDCSSSGINGISGENNQFISNLFENNAVGILLGANLDSIVVESNEFRLNGVGLSMGNSLISLMNNKFLSNSQSIDDFSITYKKNFVYNNSFGEIKWVNDSFRKNLSLIGDLGHGVNLTIEDNFIDFNSESFTGQLINSSANLTLYGIGNKGFDEPVILRNNYYECNETTVPSCYNFTPLDAETVMFNVSSWSSYSIGERLIPVSECGDLNVEDGNYILVNDIGSVEGTCFNITADGVRFNGNGHFISGDYGDGDSGLKVVGKSRIEVRELNFSKFGRGVYLNNVQDSIFFDNTLDDNQVNGLEIVNSANNTFEDNLFMGNDNGAGTAAVFVGINSENNSFLGNVLQGNKYGFNLQQLSRLNYYGGNYVVDNTHNGLYILGSDENLFEDNTVLSTNAYSMSISLGSFNNTFLNNIFTRPNYQDVSVKDDGDGRNYFVYNNSFGEIKWVNDVFLENLTVKGRLTFQGNVQVSSNLVSLDSDAFFGGNINSSANVTLRGIGDNGFDEPVIFRDEYYECNETTVPSCYNFTPLDAETVVFNVSSWSSYGIGDKSDLVYVYSCRDLDEEGKTYLLMNDVGPVVGDCFNVTANHTILDGNGFTVLGDYADIDIGIKVIGQSDVIVRNINSTGFGIGVRLSGVSDSILLDGFFEGSSGSGFSFRDSESNLIKGNSFSTLSGTYSIYAQDIINNSILENSIFGSAQRMFFIDQAVDNLFKRNTLSNGQISGFYVESSNRNIFEENLLDNAGFYGLDFEWGSYDNLVLNNKVMNSNPSAYSVYTFSLSHSDFVYNNSYGEIKWIDDSFLDLLRVRGNLTFPGSIRLADNYAQIDLSQFSSLQINSSANITLRNIGNREFEELTILRDGYPCNETTVPSCYNFTPLDAETVVFNVSSWSAYSIGDLNYVPEVTSIVFNSTFSLNRTAENLTCYVVGDDIEGDDLNVEIDFYKLPVGSGEFVLQNSYSSGFAQSPVEFQAEVNEIETAKDEVWRCDARICDDAGLCSDWSSNELEILNTPPEVPIQTRPDYWENVTDRKTQFNWDSYDADGDILTFELNITSVYGGVVFCEESYNYTVSGVETYTVPNALSCFIDDENYYLWSIRANDSESYSDWSVQSPFGIEGVLEIQLTVSSVSFGSLSPGDVEDTVDGSPPPFRIENKGNLVVNVSVANATDLWDSVGYENPTSYYQFKPGVYEAYAYNTDLSPTDWVNLPNLTPADEVPVFVELNYADEADLAEVELKLRVPPSETPGQKDSIIIFTAESAYGVGVGRKTGGKI